MADMMVFSPSDQILVGEVFPIDLVEVVADKMDDACISCQSHHENLSTMEFIIGTFLHIMCVTNEEVIGNVK